MAAILDPELLTVKRRRRKQDLRRRNVQDLYKDIMNDAGVGLRTELWLLDGKSFALQCSMAFSRGTGHGVVAFAPDDRTTIGVIDADLAVWDPGTGHILRNSENEWMSWFAVFFTSGGYPCVCGVQRGRNWDRGVIRAWDIQSDRVLWQYENGTGVKRVVPSPDYKLLAIASYDTVWNNRVTLLNTETGAVKRILTTPGSQITVGSAECFSPDGRFLAMASGSDAVQAFDVHTGNVASIVHYRAKKREVPNALAISPDGAILAIGTRAMGSTFMERLGLNYHYWGDVSLWNLKTGKLLQRMPGYNDGVVSVVFSTDGNALWFNNDKYWDISRIRTPR
jgi:WD40 repeat protein